MIIRVRVLENFLQPMSLTIIRTFSGTVSPTCLKKKRIEQGYRTTTDISKLMEKTLVGFNPTHTQKKKNYKALKILRIGEIVFLRKEHTNW